MNIIEFIHQHGIEHLASTHKVKVKNQHPYYTLNYTSQNGGSLSDFCRGVVLKCNDESTQRWSVVYNCMPRIPEKPPKRSSSLIEACDLVEKVDGSFIKLWFDDGIWHVGTRSTASVDETQSTQVAEFLAGIIIDNGSLKHPRTVSELNKHLVEFGLDQTLSYMFEVTGPGNKIILDYKKTRTFALNAIVTQTGQFVSRDTLKEKLEEAGLYVHYPEVVFEAGKFTLDQISRHLRVMDSYKNFIEGYVAYTKEGVPICKIKSDLYVKMSSTPSKDLTPRFFAMNCFKNELTPALDQPIEIFDAYVKIVNEFSSFKTTVVDGYKAAEGMHSACYADHCAKVENTSPAAGEILGKLLKKFRGKELAEDTIRGLRGRWLDKFEKI